MAEFLGIAGMLAGAEPIYKPVVMPDGTPKEINVGGIPKGTDFLDASRSIAGDTAPPAVTDKLLTLYKDQGIHPGEVVFDAQNNPGVMEDLLSADGRMPYQTSKPPPVEAEEGMAVSPDQSAISNTETKPLEGEIIPPGEEG
jgi:hypothetical protein